MPQLQQIQFSPSQSHENAGLEKTLGAFAKRNRQNQVAQQESDELKQIYGKYQNQEASIDDTILGIQSSTELSPTAKVNNVNTMINIKKQNDLNREKAVKHYEDQEKKRKEKESVYELYKQVLPEADARRRAEHDTIETARANLKVLTKETPKSEFDKVLEKKSAEDVVKLEGEIAKTDDALTNLDRILELAEGPVSGLTGLVKGALGTESAKELENLGFTSIEPIIKLFNPVGPIPVAKVKIIRDEFQPKATDLLTTIKGKVNALKRIANQGKARAQQRVALLRQYKGNPPADVVEKFDAESSQLEDVLVDHEAFQLKLEGKNPDDPINGLYSAKDGRKLGPIPAKEAVKLYNEGLITNVSAK